MSNYKLTYFDIKGRAEPLRVILAYAGVEYNDFRFDRNDLPTLRHQFPWGQVPVLHVDNFELAQTGAIARFLANRFKLTGENDWEAAKCDELVNATEDLRAEWKKVVHARSGDASKKMEARKAFLENQLPKFLEALTGVKRANVGPWLVGKSPTWADLYIAVVLESLEEAIDLPLYDSFPEIKAWMKDVYSLPKVKEYIERRR